MEKSMLIISKLIKFFLILLVSNNLYAAVNPNEAYGKVKPRKTDDPIAIANDAWNLFVGRKGYVNEKLALEKTLIAIELLKNSGDEVVLSVVVNNLSVIYGCSINENVRNLEKKLDLKRDYSDERSQENLIWSVFLKKTEFNTDISKEFHRMLETDFPSHPVKMYMDYLGKVLPQDTNAAYELLKIRANSGDADAAMRYGYRYECDFAEVDVDEAIQWYKKANKLYEKNKLNSKEINSSRERLKRLQSIKNGKFLK
jgi:hypothetical protein